MKHLDDLVLLIDRLISVFYGMLINVEKQVLSVSKQPSPTQIIIDQKQVENRNVSTIWLA